MESALGRLPRAQKNMLAEFKKNLTTPVRKVPLEEFDIYFYAIKVPNPYMLFRREQLHPESSTYFDKVKDAFIQYNQVYCLGRKAIYARVFPESETIPASSCSSDDAGEISYCKADFIMKKKHDCDFEIKEKINSCVSLCKDAVVVLTQADFDKLISEPDTKQLGSLVNLAPCELGEVAANRILGKKLDALVKQYGFTIRIQDPALYLNLVR